MKKSLAKKIMLSILTGAILLSSNVVWAAVTTPPNFDDDDWAYDGVNVWHTFGYEIQLSTGTDKNFTSAYSSTNAGVATATGGKVIISDGTLTGNIYGGYAVGLSNGGEASDNTVTINGGMFTGKICGGYVMTMPNRPVNATKNTVTISGTANLENAELFGGAAPMYPSSPVGGRPNTNVPIIGIKSDYGGAGAPNILNIGTPQYSWANLHNTSSNNIKKIAGFDIINFEHVKWDTSNPALKVNELELAPLIQNLSLNGTKITVKRLYVNSTDTTFVAGEKMVLIDSENITGPDPGISGYFNVQDSKVEAFYGVAEKYNATIDGDYNNHNIIIELDGTAQTNEAANANGTYPNSTPTVNPPGGSGNTTPQPERNDQVLVLGESRAAATAFTNQGSELIETGLNALARDNEKDTKVFAAVYGNHSEYETGSHVNVNGWSGIVGIGKTNDAGLTVGAFFENGEGNYSTHNIFTNDYIRGDGEACYNGGGFMVRKDNANGVYTEASLRAGNLQNELRNAVRNGSELTGYDIDTFYYGAHIGIGKVIARGADGDSLDVYGKFIYTHHNGETFDVGGTPTKFDSVESERLRLGFRLNEVQTNKLSMYYGAAWEYEFNGDAHDKIASFDLETPSLEGSTVIGEVGLHYNANAKWSFDLNGRAYVGQREGFSGSVQANYSF